MSDAVSVVSLVVSVASLGLTVVGLRLMSRETEETFAAIGADEGNHEARLERLEENAGLEVIPSPSALDDASQEDVSEAFSGEFVEGQEDAELRASHEVFENEGGPVFGDDFSPVSVPPLQQPLEVGDEPNGN